MNNAQIEPSSVSSSLSTPPLHKTSPSLLKSWAKLLTPIAFLILLTAILTTILRPTIIEVFDYFQSSPLGPFYFTLLYATWVVLCLSKTPISISAGFIFGFNLGFLLSFLGMTIAVILAIILVRYTPCTQGLRANGKEWLLTNYRSMTVINTAIKNNPYKACIALRFMYVPSFVKNYYLPIFEVPVLPLLVASSISSSFYCAAFCYIGSTIDTLSNAVGGKASGQGGEVKLGIVIGSIVLTFLALIGVTRRVKMYVNELEEVQKNNNESVEVP
ncbi:hypothetical protein TrLO_g13744 [Triparma laevis f. longispina]|uniref:VTT domain-containing protein n=1 Tax=Triparma laevis f. longispina TaxID=1714387 RepID=A0A9W7FPZ3_9STRA|nr:hypothetical protein TrLO_g13744 [Triparma laevis f. longispina]